MNNCASCGNRLEAAVAWKGREQRFYCNEFCADHDDAPRSFVPEFGARAMPRWGMRKAA
jgi:hypothetical protein